MKFGPAGCYDCYDLRPIRVLSVDGGHCALWLEPAVILRALFPAPQLESIRTRDICLVDIGFAALSLANLKVRKVWS